MRLEDYLTVQEVAYLNDEALLIRQRKQKLIIFHNRNIDPITKMVIEGIDIDFDEILASTLENVKNRLMSIKNFKTEDEVEIFLASKSRKTVDTPSDKLDISTDPFHDQWFIDWYHNNIISPEYRIMVKTFVKDENVEFEERKIAMYEDHHDEDYDYSYDETDNLMNSESSEDLTFFDKVERAKDLYNEASFYAKQLDMPLWATEKEAKSEHKWHLISLCVSLILAIVCFHIAKENDSVCWFFGQYSVKDFLIKFFIPSVEFFNLWLGKSYVVDNNWYIYVLFFVHVFSLIRMIIADWRIRKMRKAGMVVKHNRFIKYVARVQAYASLIFIIFMWIMMNKSSKKED